ncbi:MAG: anti sigma b factor antagonist RsbV, partial [uncultured Rubrobacteraceae bacterium]
GIQGQHRRACRHLLGSGGARRGGSPHGPEGSVRHRTGLGRRGGGGGGHGRNRVHGLDCPLDVHARQGVPGEERHLPPAHHALEGRRTHLRGHGLRGLLRHLPLPRGRHPRI